MTVLGTSTKQSAPGDAHTCVLTDAGGVKSWGASDQGQLGDGTITSRSGPVPVLGLGSNVRQIVSGALHTCALLNDGSIKCCRDNESGQIGDGTVSNRNSPVAVVGLKSAMSQLVAGYGFTCALASDGTSRCWSSNTIGQLGDGTTTTRDVPVVTHW
jgi:alpha-tubulin suppressor-like RCC1 family protein